MEKIIIATLTTLNCKFHIYPDKILIDLEGFNKNFDSKFTHKTTTEEMKSFFEVELSKLRKSNKSKASDSIFETFNDIFHGYANIFEY